MGNILSPSDQGVCMSVDKDKLALFGGSPLAWKLALEGEPVLPKMHIRSINEADDLCAG